VFHPGTLFQYETPGVMRRAFHREPRGFELKPTRPGAPQISSIWATWRLARRLLSHGAEGERRMSWLDAHDAYVMEIIVRDRVDELRSTVDVATAHTERTTAPEAVDPDARRRSTAAVFLCSHPLAKASR
jgi:hypothetical protein